jgi:hypothetical protein
MTVSNAAKKRAGRHSPKPGNTFLYQTTSRGHSCGYGDQEDWAKIISHKHSEKDKIINQSFQIIVERQHWLNLVEFKVKVLSHQ